VTVKDTGEGIDPEILPNMFSKFITKSFEGLGLGLYISKHIVKAHGGKIEGKNNNNGIGAEFGFTLPLINDTKTL
jgi:signal transduction histidine kinase